MKIRTQLLIAAAVFGAVLIVIAASAIATTEELGRLERQAALVDRIGVGASDLNYLANEYLLYSEPAQVGRWGARYDLLAADIAGLSAGNPAEQALIAALAGDRASLKSVFDDVAARTNASGGVDDHAAFQVSWSRMGVPSQALAYDAGRLSALLQDEADAARYANTVQMTALLGAFAAFVLVGVLVVGRRTLASVAALQAGANVVGSGNLEHAIPAEGDDEVADLARSFNRMTADLATVTASKADLEREMAERARAEEAVRESEARFRDILDNSLDALYRRNLRTGRFEYYSAAVEPIIGYPVEEVLAWSENAILERVHPDDLPRVRSEKMEATSSVPEGQTEYRFGRRDGTYVWLSDRFRITRDGDGRPLYRDGIVRDITDRKRAAEALKESEERFRGIVETAEEGIATHGPDGTITYVNQRMADLLGYSRDELVGRSSTDFVDDEEKEKIILSRERSHEHGDSQNEWKMRRKDGSVLWSLANVTPRRDGAGTITGYLAMHTDITDRKRAEEALRERERTLQSIFRAAPVGIGIVSHHRLVSVNEGLCRITGYAAEELAGQPTRMLYPDDETYDAVVREKYARILADGVGVVETRWRTKDGETLDVLLSSSPMDPADPYENVVTIALDLSDLRAKEAALQESEEKYRGLVEDARSIILRYDALGRITFFNEYAEQFFGYSKDEVLGRPAVGTIVPPRDSSGRDLEAMVADLAVHPELYATNENENITKNGDRVWIHWTNKPVFDADGSVREFLAVGTDITDRKRAEEALAESEERYRELFATMAEGFALHEVVCDDTGAPVDYRFLALNPAFEAMTGLSSDAVVGRTASEVLPGLEPDWVERYGRVATTGEPASFESYAAPLGRWFAVHASSPGPGRFATVFSDITERIRSEEALREHAEELRRSNEDLERYAYVSSHDLQEPLRSIVSFSQLLDRRYRGKLDQDADEYIAFIVEGGNRMQTLILDLLAYSRVNTKAQELRPTDAEAVMAAVERNLDPQLREAGATLSYDPLPTVTADPLQVEQVLSNLISNAIKFRREDEPLRIHVSAQRLDGFWEFSVRDNGIGIEKEYFDRIFVIFQRLHTKDAYPGTGIGLAIVKRIVERHGGRCRVESTPGEGSTFFFTLPAA